MTLKKVQAVLLAGVLCVSMALTKNDSSASAVEVPGKAASKLKNQKNKAVTMNK